MPSNILNYFLKHKEIIEENLRLCHDPDDIEAIHNFRLSVKRLRVVGKLADQVSDQSFGSKEKLQEVNKLFKRSGRLRDIQVTRLLVEELQEASLSSVIEGFNNKEIQQRLKFEEALNNFDKNSFTTFMTELNRILEGVSERQARLAGLQMLSLLEAEVHELYLSSAAEKRLHDIRTRLKDINYLNNIFDQSLPIQDHLNISIERLREVGELAGSWHDCLILEAILAKNIAKHPDASKQTTPVLANVTVKKEGLHDEYVCILLNEMKI